MIFHSLDFALFFGFVLLVYWRLPHRAQNLFMLAASYFFYGYVHPWFVALLAASTVWDYSLARCMARFPDRRKLFLILSVSANLGLLGFFKYFGFFVDNALWALNHVGVHASRPTLSVILPVGISFYTFQSLSYTIDVYRGRIEARRDLLDFATFLALFPQLVAGPIERATHVLPQVETPRRFDVEAARRAVVLLCWGLAKKVVVADNVAVVANKVFSIQAPGFLLLWVGTLAFGIQIYADFSAYSDIARAAARLLGFDLMKNFDHPYLAQGPAEFWRRWHISLSTWFRDYLYIPLGGNRAGPTRHYLNLLLTFLVSGLWHGASWNFVLWGLYHGLLIIVYALVTPLFGGRFRSRWLTIPRTLLCFTLITIGWLMFRETDTTQLIRDLTLRPSLGSADERMVAGHLLGLVGFYSLPLVVDELLYIFKLYEHPRRALGWVLAEAGLVCLLVLSMGLLYSDAPSDFIYFQF